MEADVVVTSRGAAITSTSNNSTGATTEVTADANSNGAMWEIVSAGSTSMIAIGKAKHGHGHLSSSDNPDDNKLVRLFSIIG